MHHDFLSMEVHSVNQELFVSSRLFCTLLLPNAIFLGLNHDTVGCLGAYAEIIDMGWFYGLRLIEAHDNIEFSEITINLMSSKLNIMWGEAAIVLCLMLTLCSPACITSFNIKHSK